MDKSYSHKDHEDKIYKKWEQSGAFTPKIDPDKKPFVISMPPPNVTGELHIGHALFVTLQDILTRYHRMCGEPTLWLPGTDHAGIATQAVVDRALRKQGINKNDLGREKFIEEVWKWKKQYGGAITRQIRKIGASCDWSRERFTLDEGLSESVREAFVLLYKKNLIYQGLRTVNWCPRCHTAIADDEVEYKSEVGKFYWIKYGPFTLATARPETKLGDTAVAVHPKDPRYADMVGKKYKIPGVLGEFEIIVVADNAVDPKFGTGAVKVTPAHSLIDFEIAQRHDIPMKQVIDENGRMMANTGKYAGMKTKEARQEIVKDMQEMGSIDHIEENYEHNIATCYRCGGQIEPIPSKQWFVKMKPLAQKAKKAVESGEIKIMPKRFEKVYFHWLDNIRDWCISRQLWWGHQIPVWYKNKTKAMMGFADRVAPQLYKGKTKTYRLRDHNLKKGDVLDFENSQTHEYLGLGVIKSVQKVKVEDLPLQDKAHGDVYNKLEELIDAFKEFYPHLDIKRETDAWIYEFDFKQMKVKEEEKIYVGKEAPNGEGWTQDEDVLDTWFSSALWPFSTLGWPDKKSKDYQYFFPTTVMETGYDILFFWVARMIMMSLELTGDVPFKTVYLHGLVRDEQNRKMSKSLGNGIDPIEVINKYGADALRMALVVGATPGNDIAMGESKIRGYRNFSNKVWNIARFVIMNLENNNLKDTNSKQSSNFKFSKQDEADFKRLDEVVKKTTKHLDNFQFSQAGELLYGYVWHEFADKIIEEAKPRINGNNLEDKSTVLYKLCKILENILVMLHPFMPFVTEEVWQELKKELELESDLISTPWPKAETKN